MPISRLLLLPQGNFRRGTHATFITIGMSVRVKVEEENQARIAPQACSIPKPFECHMTYGTSCVQNLIFINQGREKSRERERDSEVKHRWRMLASRGKGKRTADWCSHWVTSLDGAKQHATELSLGVLRVPKFHLAMFRFFRSTWGRRHPLWLPLPSCHEKEIQKERVHSKYELGILMHGMLIFSQRMGGGDIIEIWVYMPKTKKMWHSLFEPRSP